MMCLEPLRLCVRAGSVLLLRGHLPISHRASACCRSGSRSSSPRYTLRPGSRSTGHVRISFLAREDLRDTSLAQLAALRGATQPPRNAVEVDGDDNDPQPTDECPAN